MSLATVDADGLPNVRMVLMKGFDERGFVFYTNVDSQKGRELDANPARRVAVSLEINEPAGSVARADRQSGRRRGGCLFRHAAAARPDRRLGQPAVRSAREPLRLEKAIAVHDREIRGRRYSQAAQLDPAFGWSP